MRRHMQQKKSFEHAILNSKGRGRLAHYAPEGPDGAEAVDAEHAADINEAAEMYSRIIGSNYFTDPPEYKESYGPVSGSVQKHAVHGTSEPLAKSNRMLRQAQASQTSEHSPLQINKYIVCSVRSW